MKNTILLLSCFLSSVFLASAQTQSKTWVPDQGDGTYINPIIHADYSDPDVCAVGDDFFMTSSSFASTPGLPILHSKDLVNWTLVNYAVKKLIPEEFYNVPRHGKGIWAPSIRCHNEEYYIYWGDPDFGIYMVKTKNPYGKWNDPILVKGGKGMIDPTPLWDEDGKAYIVHAWAGSRAGFNSVITISEMNQAGTEIISDPILVYDGNDGVNHTVEGPKLYKRNGFYYIFAPAGGVETGWQIVLRSKNIYGPYECRKVMAQGRSSINGPHQGGWVDTKTGESWFINFQDKGAYGRLLHLNPMKWKDNWPVIGIDKDGDGCGEPVDRYKKPNVGKTYPKASPVESDEFNSKELGLQWEWHANYQDTFGFTSNLGFVRVYSHILSKDFKNCWEVPNMLLQKFPAEEFTALSKMKISAKADGQQSGLIIMGHDYCYLGVEKSGDGFMLKQVICKDAEKGNSENLIESIELPANNRFEAGLFPNYERDIYLGVKVKKGGFCTLVYSLDGKKYKSIGQIFKARQGKWIGAKLGIFSTVPFGKDRGWVDVDWFHLEK